MIRKLVSNALLTLVLAAVTVAAVVGFNRLAAPQPCILPPTGVEPPDYKAIASTVTEDALRRDLEALCATDSRFSGSAGCEQAADFIAKTLRDLGYTIIEQPFEVTVPQTRLARITDEAGRELDGVRIHPLLPNWFRTASTPPEGLRGKAFQAEKGLAREFKGVDLRGNFALLPLGVPWTTVAGMGAKAVLYFDDGKTDPGASWGDHLDASVNVPRFLVTGDATRLAGKTVTLVARVDFAPRVVRNIVAILDPPQPTGEALVVNAFYDAYSYAPDLAPGAQQACGAAALLSTARHLAAEAKHLRRSVVLVATAGHGQGLFGARELFRTLGVREERAEALDSARAELKTLETELGLAQATSRVAEDAIYWSAIGRTAEDAWWASRPKEVREVFTGLFRAALDDDLMAALEDSVARRVDWVRDGLAVRGADGGEAPSFAAYSDARKREQTIQAVIATPLGKLKEQWAAGSGQWTVDSGQWAKELPRRVVAKAVERIKVLDARRQELSARVRVAEAFAHFGRVLFLGLDLTPRTGRIALVCGQPGLASTCMPADAEVAAQFRRAAARLGEADPAVAYEKTKAGQPRFANLLRENDVRDLGFISEWYGAPTYFESLAALMAGHTAFTVATLGDNRERMGTPFDRLDDVLKPREAAGEESPLGNLCVATRLVAAAASQLARGAGRIVPVSRGSEIYAVHGEVVSQIGESLTPNHPMPGAVVRFGPVTVWGYPIVLPPGVGRDLAVSADWRGRFELAGVWPNVLSFDWGSPTDIDVAAVRPSDGEVTWTLSTPKSGPQAPYSVRGVKLAQFRKSLASAVVFRAAPVQVVPMADPATLRPYAGFDFIETKSMAAPQEFKTETSGGTHVCFVPPESRLYFTFKKGRRSNPSLMEIRAFALGATGPADGAQIHSDQEIVGEGYLAADWPSIPNIELDAALSMAQVNARRTRLQERYGMADDLVRSYDRKAIELADQAEKLAKAGQMVEAKQVASESLAYSSNIHPVIRKNASDAIVGILFYLFLAIPFALFMEKLLVGHPDLRWQIAFQALLFILFFAMLRAVHPAVQLVRSSYMILLGFITFALAALVSAFVAGRFSKNIGELSRRFQERAEAADVSRAGAAATAFLLGLGNLRKRPVRTGLTIGTLILTTFVMLCFASVSTDLVDVEFALGKAPYTGLLIRDRNLKDVNQALAPLRELYGESYVVARRDWGGSFAVGYGQSPELAQFTIEHAVGEGGRSFEATANAVLGLSHREPEVTPIAKAFDVLARWFDDDTEHACFLPRSMADQLRVADAAVKRGEAEVAIGGRKYAVLGIFDAGRLDAMLDLDGEPLLPLDILAVRNPGQSVTATSTEESADIPEDIPRLAASRVIITPVEAMPSRALTASVAVALSGLDYKAGREVITTHLERSAEPTYYGLDGVAFYGGKFRMQSVEGILDLVLPIVIAALTVLNTMRGSVYERQGELYVFNAVGLAPNHIRSLFLAEACVYAVVGAVGGYLVAQGVGTGLKAAGLTAGLTMNYSSLSSVFVSVVIIGVVLASSLYPARMAARLAAPAELMTRQRHTAEGDAMEFDLPFTFNRRDRVAIVPYFVDWFENYGEGSSGEFFCSPPACGIRAEADGSAAPFVETTTWLKPYDLGVSQAVGLVVREKDSRSHFCEAPEGPSREMTPGVFFARDNVATVVMTRKSGDRDSWERCCHAFVGLLRKRFLTWRAIPDGERARLLERGRGMLEKCVTR